MKKLFIITILILCLAGLLFAGKWPKGVKELKIKSNTTFTIAGNLKNGRIIKDLSWASSGSVACFPATQNESFRGKHVFYGTYIPRQSIMKIKVIPSKELNISLYAYMISTTDFERFPPDLYAYRLSSKDFKTMPPKVYTGACEASFSYRGRNPGEEEKVQFYSARNPYNIIIGVAGPENVTSGEFTLKAKLTSRK